jgi:hypothetical protein
MNRSPRFRPLAIVWLAPLPFVLAAGAGEIPTPEAHLGYRPGADFRLVDWPTVTDYFRKVDRASDRVEVRELGTTTEGRPYLVAVVSTPEAVANQAHYRRLQQRLSDPRVVSAADDPADPVGAGKSVVVITCSIHSSETASTFMAMELLHELAAKDDPATLEILEKTIVLLVPSANPDGVDKVARWYERSKGHPWEGSGMPELYHHYAGHDTNRDWFMLNLKETRLLTRLLYRDWFPTILYDVHQMGSRGPRLFVPPFHDPVNPNLDPRIHQSIRLVGAHMAADLAANGRRGVVSEAIYDNWWNGGNRTTPQRHNIVGVLTEAASVRMASPVFLEKSELQGGMRGFSDHRAAVNFAEPWPGGWWRLRDIVDYELTCARSLLTLAARYRTQFQQNLAAMARDAVEKGRREPPFAWVVAIDQRDPGTAAAMVRILHESGIEVRRATSSFTAGGAAFAAGSWVLPASQPYRAHLKDMMERQAYPARFGADGKAEPPYDVAGWTLPLQMGVRAVEVAEPFEADTEILQQVEPPRSKLEERGASEYLMLRNEANDDFIVLNHLLKAGVDLQATVRSRGDGAPPFGCVRFRDRAETRAVLEEVMPTVSSTIGRLSSEQRSRSTPDSTRQVRPARIGVYQPWLPSIDEGWTRFVLERFDVPYVTLHNADIRAGDLGKRIDILLIPSIDPKTLRAGYGVDETEPQHVGGLGAEGAAALRAFVSSGGTLVCLENASEYAISALGLPVRNVLRGLKTSEFYGPGSIVRAVVPYGERGSARLLLGVRDEVSLYFDRSLAFEVSKDSSARVLLQYADEPLESGWLLGPEKLTGRAALVEVPEREGRVILFAFPPQHRGQTHGTFRLLFNALLRVE